MSELREHRDSEDELAPTDKRETEESSAAHGAFGVIQESIDTGVFECSGIVFDEEVSEEPAEHAEDLVGFFGRPIVDSDQNLSGDGDEW